VRGEQKDGECATLVNSDFHAHWWRHQSALKSELGLVVMLEVASQQLQSSMSTDTHGT